MEHKRLSELIDVVAAIASFQFERRATVTDRGDLFDTLALGVNALAVEVGARIEREQVYQRHLADHERWQAVEQLAVGVAHEVNNPAAYVMANLTLVEQTLAHMAALAKQGQAAPETMATLAEQAHAMTRENIGGLERIVSTVRQLQQFTRRGDAEPTPELRLPIVTGEFAARSTLHSTLGSGESPATAARPRLLLIDDEQPLLIAYRRVLANEYDVELAVGGAEAIDRLTHDQSWDAILCDVTMPGIDGTGVLEWITHRAPALESRLIFCTGGAFTPRGAQLVEQYADRVLQKPFVLSELHSAVDRIAILAAPTR